MRVMLQRLSRIPKMGLFLANRQTKRCGCAKKKPSPGGEVAAQPTEGDLRAKRCGYPFGQNALKSKYSHSPSVACGASFPPGDAFIVPPLSVYLLFVGSLNRMTWRKRRLVSSLAQDGCVKKPRQKPFAIVFLKNISKGSFVAV